MGRSYTLLLIGEKTNKVNKRITNNEKVNIFGNSIVLLLIGIIADVFIGIITLKESVSQTTIQRLFGLQTVTFQYYALFLIFPLIYIIYSHYTLMKGDDFGN